MANGLDLVPSGPKSTRAPRQKMLRKVLLDHGGHIYNGTVRNISITGAMIEGLWNVPVNTVFELQLSRTMTITCQTRWSEDDRMGVQFATPLEKDKTGQIIAIQEPAPKQIEPEELRKAS